MIECVTIGVLPFVCNLLVRLRLLPSVIKLFCCFFYVAINCVTYSNYFRILKERYFILLHCKLYLFWNILDWDIIFPCQTNVFIASLMICLNLFQISCMLFESLRNRAQRTDISSEYLQNVRNHVKQMLIIIFL